MRNNVPKGLRGEHYPIVFLLALQRQLCELAFSYFTIIISDSSVSNGRTLSNVFACTFATQLNKMNVYTRGNIYSKYSLYNIMSVSEIYNFLYVLLPPSPPSAPVGLFLHPLLQ